MTNWAIAYGAVLCVSVGLGISACSSPRHLAPVENRGLPSSRAATTGAPVLRETKRLPPGFENAGKPGYYTVRPGDTLMRISIETGQSRHDIAQWNNLTDTNLIEVGQVLRVAPLTPKPNAAAAEPAPGVVIKGITSSKVDIKPLDIENKPKNVSPAFSASAPSSAASSAASSPVSAPSADLHQVKRGEDGIEWGWPAAGPVAFGFDKATPKGLVIEGKAGDPVFAAADGHVVYAGSGLRGYGNLVIIKHTANYLTAYAHNQKLLVKEDSSVKRGQRIAEMGASEAQKVQLHFEVRRQGKPIDPEKVLPVR